MSNLPAEAFAWLDGALAFLPALVRALLWGAVGGGASMGIYAIVSPQRRLRELKGAVRTARSEVFAHDGGFEEGIVLLRRQLGLSLRVLALTLVPVALASIPVLLLMVGMSSRFSGQAALISGVPPWIGEWEAPFFGALFATSVALKAGFRIQ